MAIGERIHFFRTLRGMTQKYLGMAVGFPERSADVRLAQYETGTRTPKADLTAALAHTLDVSPQALSVPDIDNYIGLAHTLFALEDVYSLKVVEADGRACLQADIFQGGRQASELNKILIAWREQAAKLEAGEITKEDYDRRLDPYSLRGAGPDQRADCQRSAPYQPDCVRYHVQAARYDRVGINI